MQSFTYKGPVDDPGKLRLEIGDTISGNGPRPQSKNYSNSEISYFLDGRTFHEANIKALQTLATEWASYAGSVKVGDVSEAFGQAAMYQLRVDELKNFNPQSFGTGAKTWLQD